MTLEIQVSFKTLNECAHFHVTFLAGGEFRDQKTTQRRFSILSTAANNAPGFDQPLLIKATEDRPFLVVQNKTVDGNLILTASMDGNMRLYDSRDGSLVKTISGHTASVNGVFITSDDAYIISCAGNYDPAWQTKKVLNGDNTDNTIRIWDLPSGKQILRLPVQGAPVVCHYLGVTAVAANEAGTMIISGGFDRAVCIWDRSTGKLLSKFGGLVEQTTANGTIYADSNAYHSGVITAVTTYTHPSDTKLDLLQRAVSISDDSSIRVWDIGMSSPTAFIELQCIGPSTARCRQPSPDAHTQAVTCMTVLNMPPNRPILITGKSFICGLGSFSRGVRKTARLCFESRVSA
jgi:WD40 repeat protein